MEQKHIQLTVWGLLGVGVLLSYFFLVKWAYPDLSKLWYGTPRWVQWMAYGMWFLAAVGSVAYAYLIPFSWTRLCLVSLLLTTSMAWSYALIGNAPKTVTMSILILVAATCIGLVSYEVVNRSNWYIVLCLIPLLFINVVLDGGVWNYYYFLNAK